jgi:hypothetical protein
MSQAVAGVGFLRFEELACTNEDLANALQLEDNYPPIKQRYLDMIEQCFGVEACTFMTMLMMRWNDQDMPVFAILDRIGATPMVWSTRGGQPMLCSMAKCVRVHRPDAFVFQVTKANGFSIMHDYTTPFVLFTSEAKDLDFRRHAKIFAEIPYEDREFLESVSKAGALVAEFHNLTIDRMRERETSPSASSSAVEKGLRIFHFSPGEANPISSAFEKVPKILGHLGNHRIVQHAYGRVRQRYAELVEQSFGLDAYAFMLELAILWKAPSLNGFKTAAAVGATPMVWSTRDGAQMLLRLENDGPKVQFPDAFVFQVSKGPQAVLLHPLAETRHARHTGNACTTPFVVFTSKAKDLDFETYGSILGSIPYENREFLESVLTAGAAVDDLNSICGEIPQTTDGMAVNDLNKLCDEIPYLVSVLAIDRNRAFVEEERRLEEGRLEELQHASLLAAEKILEEEQLEKDLQLLKSSRAYQEEVKAQNAIKSAKDKKRVEERKKRLEEESVAKKEMEMQKKQWAAEGAADAAISSAIARAKEAWAANDRIDARKRISSAAQRHSANASEKKRQELKGLKQEFGSTREAKKPLASCSMPFTPPPTPPIQSSDEKKAVETQAATAPTAAPTADERLCVVCMDMSVTHAAAPCGHVCLCGDCALLVKNSKKPTCPTCRAEIALIMKLFF